MHVVLYHMLFDSLPILPDIRLILMDIYTNTKCSYDSFLVMQLAGVNEGDSLYPILFNLASEPIRLAARQINGMNQCGSKKVITTYTDDSAIINTCQVEMDKNLESIFLMASSQGLKFKEIQFDEFY